MGGMEDLFALLRVDAQGLRTEFEKAKIQGRGTPQDIATFSETALQETLRNYFPFPYRVAKGGISDSEGNKSASVDCVLVNPAHPYTIDRRENFKLILAEGVEAAIEVKPDIAQKSELQRGLKQGLTVKKLRRAASPLLSLNRHSEELKDYFTRVPFFIFSMKAKTDIFETAQEVLDFYEENNVTTLDQADAIIVDGIGILSHYPLEKLSTLPQISTKFPRTGWFFEGWREDTLAGFLVKLNTVVSAVPHVTVPVLRRYLKFPAMEIVSLDYTPLDRGEGEGT